MITEYIEDGGRKIFRVSIESVNLSMFQAAVDSVTEWDVDSVDPTDFEPYLRCLIKWDSCSHFNFPQQLHLCGVIYFEQHVLLMRELYTMAFRHMGRRPQDDEQWTKERSGEDGLVLPTDQ